MSKADFEKLVKQAIKALPSHIREKMENVAIVIERKPSSSGLLGLYQGVPNTTWGKGFGQILPDKITIYQEPIEKLATKPKEIKEIVKFVVWHEIAHHFGFSESQVRALESKWRKRTPGSLTRQNLLKC